VRRLRIHQEIEFGTLGHIALAENVAAHYVDAANLVQKRATIEIDAVGKVGEWPTKQEVHLARILAGQAVHGIRGVLLLQFLLLIDLRIAAHIVEAILAMEFGGVRPSAWHNGFGAAFEDGNLWRRCKIRRV